jgi:hypothetical protein
VDHAREIAETGDQWFLSLAAGLGRAGGWARKEADIAADSAVAAFATTMLVAKKLIALSVVGLEPRTPLSHNDGEPVRHKGSGSVRPEVTLDLVSAIRPDDGDYLDARVAERLGVKQDDPPVPRPAGVVPLLQALGRTVATHAQAGYASLQEDPRFWTLVHLVQALGSPTIAPLHSDEVGERPTADPMAATLGGEASEAQPNDPHLYPDTRRDQ